MSKPDHLQIEYRSPHELKPYPHNAKIHSRQQIRKLVKSLKRFGFVKPALISDNDEIIAGEACVKAAKHIGLKLIPTIRLSSLTPADRLAYNLADNRLAEFGRYDRKLLAIQLEELTKFGFDEIDVTGFSLGDIDIHLGEPSGKGQNAAGRDDELPLPGKIVVSRKGDLWTWGAIVFCAGTPLWPRIASF